MPAVSLAAVFDELQAAAQAIAARESRSSRPLRGAGATAARVQPQQYAGLEHRRSVPSSAQGPARLPMPLRSGTGQAAAGPRPPAPDTGRETGGLDGSGHGMVSAASSITATGSSLHDGFGHVSMHAQQPQQASLTSPGAGLSHSPSAPVLSALAPPRPLQALKPPKVSLRPVLPRHSVLVRAASLQPTCCRPRVARPCGRCGSRGSAAFCPA
jgi:hypothetical protein